MKPSVHIEGRNTWSLPSAIVAQLYLPQPPRPTKYCVFIFVFAFVFAFVFVFVFVFAFLFSTHGACQVPLLANFVCPSPTECCEAVSQKEFCQKTIWSRRGHFKRDLGQPTLICGKDPKNVNVSEKTHFVRPAKSTH